MLQSNTDATSFKLQPAPRPRSKKRPHNPPPIIAATPSHANASFCSSSGSDNKSLRSCFEDDEDQIVTPKASLSNVALLDDAVGSSPGTRSSTISLVSATSATSNSVPRLLATMSVSPRRPRSTTSSPSATVTVMLSNRSPTPSTPLFPRRTLMRSLSSTCVTPTSPGATLRKRMGWRGAASARVYDETAILMSPCSPLTPRRAEALHTPTQASIDSLLLRQEPTLTLSATLKALGAKRKTQRFESTCVPVQSPDCTEVKSPSTDAEKDEFELMTATRKIFHLPTWVRFEANHHARTRVAQENRQAVVEYAQLRKVAAAKPGKACDGGEALEVETLPKTSQLGDVAPSSPNGDLLAGFDLDPSPQKQQQREEEQSEYVVSVVRRPTLAAMREMDVGGAPTRPNVLGAIRSALTVRPQRRIKPPAYPRKPLLLSPSSPRCDGWGGIMTRSSWFPNHTRGPLVSPDPAKTRGLKVMLPQPMLAGKKGERSDDEWEDVVEPSPNEPPAEKSFLDLHDAPRFFNRPPTTTRRWFPSSKQHRSSQLDTWQTIPLQPIDKDQVASHLISTGKSVKNRPLAKASRRTRMVKIAVSIVLVSALVANVVVSCRARATPSPGDADKITFDPLVGSLPPNSTAARAAQLSQP